MALLVLRGRKTDHAIMLEEKEERKIDVNKKREKQKEAGTKRASGEKEDKKRSNSGQKCLHKNSPLLLRGVVNFPQCGCSCDGRLAAFHWPTLSLSLCVSGFHYSCYDVLCSGQVLHNSLPVIALLV